MNHTGSVRKTNEAGACEHCGALVYPDCKECAQCGNFPIKLHLCTRCGFISPEEASRCAKCGRMFSPDGDYL